MKIRTLALASAIATAIAAPAHATVVTTWSYQVDSGFTNTVGATGSLTNTALGAPSRLQWGIPDNNQNAQSALFVTGNHANGDQTGSITTGAAAVNTVTVSHDNNVISGNSTSLSSTTLVDQLLLTPTSPAGLQQPPLALAFNILFSETPNATPCAATSPANNPCNDIFVVSLSSGAGALLNTSTPSNVFLTQPFNYGGENYLISLFISGFSVLSDSACAAVGAGHGCVGFTTVEDQLTTFQVSLKIDAVSVPEPLTLSLFGAGLLGIGAFGLRRKTKA